MKARHVLIIICGLVFLERFIQYGYKYLIASTFKVFGSEDHTGNAFYHYFNSMLPIAAVVFSFLSDIFISSKIILGIFFVYFCGLSFSWFAVYQKKVFCYKIAFVLSALGCGGLAVLLPGFGRTCTKNSNFFLNIGYFINGGCFLGYYIADYLMNNFGPEITYFLILAVSVLMFLVFFLIFVTYDHSRQNDEKTEQNSKDLESKNQNDEKTEQNSEDFESKNQNDEKTKQNSEDFESRNQNNEKTEQNSKNKNNHSDVVADHPENQRESELNFDRTAHLPIFSIILLYLPLIPYFAMKEQYNSSFKTLSLNLKEVPFLKRSQVQILNPLFYCLLVPVVKIIPLDMPFKIILGYFMAVFSFFICLLIEKFRTESTSILVMIIPFSLLSFGEILCYTTNQEYAYTIAPPNRKFLVMSFIRLMAFIGNFIVGRVYETKILKNVSHEFFTWGSLGIFGGTIYTFVILFYERKRRNAKVFLK
ncbi:Peptide transporter [Pseudoloma neurophilia]|uniref:Peptide transporter n=1 Tax=Pseudoloma neurophilia TaxID=146866 RepID=A0A0R0M7B5_9MICR|nr:Peptide transporter [Pseudoloma neurophilia]